MLPQTADLRAPAAALAPLKRAFFVTVMVVEAGSYTTIGYLKIERMPVTQLLPG